MTYHPIEGQSAAQANEYLAEILAGFKKVLTQCGTSDSTKIEFTFVDRQLEPEGFSLLPAGCKYKCWYSQSTHSTQCGIVCSLGV